MFLSVASSTVRTLAVLVLAIAAITAVAVKGFDLTVFGALALFFVLWWTFLFAVLPLGNQAETDPSRVVRGQDPGAPARPRLREKALLTTVAAAFAFFIALVVFPLARL
nr:DUF1467 family protein [Methylobacterium gnaphalii]